MPTESQSEQENSGMGCARDSPSNGGSEGPIAFLPFLLRDVFRCNASYEVLCFLQGKIRRKKKQEEIISFLT